MSYEAWGEPEEGPELPDGWWNEDDVQQVKDCISDLNKETLYEKGRKDNGISVRFLARITLLQGAAGLLEYDDPMLLEARSMFETHNVKLRGSEAVPLE